jgi:hypothetical protein
MAVQSATSSISYTGNNSTVTTYAVPFYFLENAHLAAIAKVTATGVETAITLTNHTGAGDINGGTVRTSVAVPATSTLNIFRTVPATQTTQYQEGGDFPAASHERALDKLTFISQQNARAVQRSFRVTEGSGTKNEVVAVPNTLLGLDNNNQPKALTVDQVKSLLSITGVTLDVDAGMKTFADAGERALNVPDFTGQLGTQRDTADIYISTGTAAGNWSLVDENMSLADFASGFFTADATGRGKFASGFVDAGLLASDAVTTAKILDANVTDAKLATGIDASKLTTGTLPIARIADAAVTPAKLSQPLTLATAVATTSGTSIDFTGIPSWAKRITVMLNQVSTNGTSIPILQIGDSGGIETSAYSSVCAGAATTPIDTTRGGSSSDGFRLTINAHAAADLITGKIDLINISSNNWIAQGALNLASVLAALVVGSKALSDALDRIRLTTSNGTDTFDAGSVNIIYEG